MGLDPKVEAPEHIRTGDFANAFRVGTDESGCVLDFLTYSEREQTAVVVSRIRVSLEFLPLIRDHLSAAVAA